MNKMLISYCVKTTFLIKFALFEFLVSYSTIKIFFCSQFSANVPVFWKHTSVHCTHILSSFSKVEMQFLSLYFLKFSSVFQKLLKCYICVQEGDFKSKVSWIFVFISMKYSHYKKSYINWRKNILKALWTSKRRSRNNQFP